MASKEIASELRKQGEELRRKAQYLMDLAEEFEGVTPVKPGNKLYDQERINRDLAVALTMREIGAKNVNWSVHDIGISLPRRVEDSSRLDRRATRAD